MKNSKQSLNELDISTYFFAIGGEELITGGLAMLIIRKVTKFFGSKFKNAGEFFRFLRNPFKLKQAGVTDDEINKLYANKGAVIVDIAEQFNKELIKKVANGNMTPEQAMAQLEGLIPDSQKAVWLKKLKALYPGSKTAGASAASNTVKNIYTKVAGSILPKDASFKQAVLNAYGSTNKIDELYTAYERAFTSGKLAIPFKGESRFPSKQEWLDVTGWKPQNVNIGLNDKLIAQNNAYNWQKFIWALYR
jgi:hypothetical protein